MTDSSNCGACGHSCLGGGCIEGRCQPVAFASGAFPTGIAIDDTAVYWTEDDLPDLSRGVQRCDISHCNGHPTRLATGRLWPTGIAVDATRVYWADRSTISSCPKTIGSNISTALFSSESFLPRSGQQSLAIDAENVYWIGSNGADAGTSGRLNRCAKSASPCSPVVLATLDAPVGVASDGADVFVTASSTVSKCAVTGCNGNPTVLASGQTAGPYAIALDETDVYWTLLNGGIARCKKGGCANAPTQLVSLPPGNANVAIALDDTNVYWLLENSGVLMRCAKTGCNDTPTILASQLDHPRGIVVDAVSIFFTVAYPPGHVMRLAK